MRQRIILALSMALIASACQKKAEGQTVAVVNDEEITSAELNDALTSDNSLDGLGTKEARAAELDKLVNRKLIVQQARADGIDKSPEFISQQRRLTEDLLINMLLGKRLNTSQVPSADEIARFEAGRPEIFSSREIWSLNQILYPLPKDPAVKAKLEAAKSLDEIAQILTASGIEFKRGSKKLDTAVFPHPVYEQINKLAQGEPFIAPGPDKAVASVITAREPAPLTPQQAREVALNAMRKDQAQKILEDRVKELRAKAKIEYQAGFGPPKK